MFAEHQMSNTERIACENSLEYIPSISRDRIYKNGKPYIPRVNSLYCEGYICLYPINNGILTSPIEWYTKEEVPKKIMDNRTSFKCITNLAEIISTIISLYEKYIDEDILISSYSFYLKLENELVEDYKGKASLVLTDSTIRNSKMSKTEIANGKIYFINDFLEHFIGWNFGKVIKENPELEDQLLKFNKLVIEKGIRERSSSGLMMSYSDDVVEYVLNVE